jgi:predicted HTH transcriptional regulator
MEAVIVKTVAALLNSLNGGVLLIGVSDDGSIVGLQHDYQTLARRDRDGFQSFLVKLLTDAYGKDVSMFLHMDFHQLENHDVCRIAVKPCAHPVYVDDEKFYLRSGNTTLKLTTRETIEYFKTRWK